MAAGSIVSMKDRVLCPSGDQGAESRSTEGWHVRRESEPLQHHSLYTTSISETPSEARLNYIDPATQTCPILQKRGVPAIP